MILPILSIYPVLSESVKVISESYIQQAAGLDHPCVSLQTEPFYSFYFRIIVAFVAITADTTLIMLITEHTECVLLIR